ncbi:MAG: SGNH/GDSL hydrolase family protein [Candidatus Omnitrophota bacterium]
MKIKIGWLKNNTRYKLTIKGITLLFLSGVLVSFLIGELMVRFFVSFPINREYLRFECLGYKLISQKARDAQLFWKPIPEFRGESYQEKKEDGVFRIICIGDSVTQSHGIDGFPLPRENTYVFYLEKLLESGYENKKFEVINAGVGGYSSLQGVRYLEGKLIKYNPDLVISWFGINDRGQAVFYNDKQQKLPLKESLEKTGGSKLYKFIKNYFLIMQYMPRVSYGDYYENCEQMLKLSKKNYFDIVFITPFEADVHGSLIYLNDYKEALEKLADNYDSTVLDVPPFFKYKAKNMFIDSCHPDKEGNTVVAETIYTLLKESGVFDKINSN